MSTTRFVHSHVGSWQVEHHGAKQLAIYAVVFRSVDEKSVRTSAGGTKSVGFVPSLVSGNRGNSFHK